MNKKWLYSVAMGALLIAGEALGITVHDVLSNGFWSAEQRGTYEYLDKATGYRAKTSSGRYKLKETDVAYEQIGVWTVKGPKIDGLKWKARFWRNDIISVHFDKTKTSEKEKLIATCNKTHKEKTITYRQSDIQKFVYPTNTVETASSTYIVKPLKKDVRPMGPLVVDDWFPSSIEKDKSLDAQFYGTEENAVTNIISDNEAYITRTIAQTGYLWDYEGYPVNEDTSLLRTYNTHITTDDDHVYVDQTICENSTNNPKYNQQDAYQTQYVATFKKGQWKNSTETITHTSNKQAADWYLNYLKQEQTTRISSQQPDYLSQRLKDTQNFR